MLRIVRIDPDLRGQRVRRGVRERGALLGGQEDPQRIDRHRRVERRDLVAQERVDLVQQAGQLRGPLQIAPQPEKVVGQAARGRRRPPMGSDRPMIGAAGAASSSPPSTHVSLVALPCCSETIASAPVGLKRVRPPGITR